MKAVLPLVISLLVAALAGCGDARKEVEKTKADAAAKARAEAAKKEMETLPKAFRSRDIFEKNEPAKSAPKPTEATTTKNP